MIAVAAAVARKEIASFFYSPIAYGVATIVLALNGALFFVYLTLLQGNLTETIPVFFGGYFLYWFVVILVPPLLAMRLFAEEKRSGTIEMLMTAPVSDLAVVLGKYAAALAYWTLLWVPAFGYFVVVSRLGGEPDFGVVASGMIATLLTGALFLAIGLFASATTSNQVLAAVGAIVGNLVLFFAPLLAHLFRAPGAREFVERYSIYDVYFSSFLNGVLDTGHVVYLLSLTALFLFFTVRTVEARKWR